MNTLSYINCTLYLQWACFNTHRIKRSFVYYLDRQIRENFYILYLKPV